MPRAILRAPHREGNAGEGGESEEEGRTPMRKVRAPMGLWEGTIDIGISGVGGPYFDRGKRRRAGGEHDDMWAIVVSQKEMRSPGHVI
jgi:hypothetical protein